MFEGHVNEPNVRAEVHMTDDAGLPTDRYDVAGGIQYSSTNAAAVDIVDHDANPKDARIDFLALTGPDEDVFLECSFDGDTGEGVRRHTLRSEAIRVVPGEATGGEMRVIRFSPVPPPE